MALFLTSPFGGGAKYCVECVSLTVCLVTRQRCCSGKKPKELMIMNRKKYFREYNAIVVCYLFRYNALADKPTARRTDPSTKRDVKSLGVSLNFGEVWTFCVRQWLCPWCCWKDNWYSRALFCTLMDEMSPIWTKLSDKSLLRRILMQLSRVKPTLTLLGVTCIGVNINDMDNTSVQYSAQNY